MDDVDTAAKPAAKPLVNFVTGLCVEAVDRFTAPVELTPPGSDDVFVITGRFRYLPFNEMQAHIDAIRAEPETKLADELKADPLHIDRNEIQVCKMYFLGWDDGIFDTSGQPLAATPELIDEYLGRLWFRRGVINAYRAHAYGERARLGN